MAEAEKKNMKIISLNIWGGKVKEPLLDFFRRYSGDVDVFCLQEVHHGGEPVKYSGFKPIEFDAESMKIFNDIQDTLPNHQGYFYASQSGGEGLAIFAKKEISINEEKDIFIHRWKDAMENGDSRTMGRNLQYISFASGGETCVVGNFHGLWNGVNKLDSGDRLIQSENIANFFKGRKEKRKILVGDFNLLPETESIKIIEKEMKNLISEFGVVSTRSNLYTKPIKFADYIFVSPEVSVRDFKTLDEEVSDHLPLYLEIE